MESIKKNKNDNIFIFTFVRMNPPTPGHLLVIKQMIEEAIQHNMDKIYILLSSTIDEKNPLACSKEPISEIDDIVKKDILNNLIESYRKTLFEKETDPERKMKIENMKIIIECAIGNSFGFINSIIRTDFSNINDLNMIFIVGEDRTDFAISLEKYFSKRDTVKSFGSKILPRFGMETLKNKEMNDTSIRDIPLEQYSASFIRNLVKSKNESAFKEAYSPYLEESMINKLYNTLSINLSKYQKELKPTSNLKPKPKTKTKKREREPSPEKIKPEPKKRTRTRSVRSGGKTRRYKK
jgi:hypothetical protein